MIKSLLCTSTKINWRPKRRKLRISVFPRQFSNPVFAKEYVQLNVLSHMNHVNLETQQQLF